MESATYTKKLTDPGSAAVGGLLKVAAVRFRGARTAAKTADDLPAVAPKATKSAAGACSFGGETLVLMADGTTRPISEVEVGDMVLAQDPETGEIGARRVTDTWVHDDDLVRLEVGGVVVRTTEDHPFWNDTDREWQRADQLDRGDLVLTADGRRVKVGVLDSSAGRGSAYNFTVEGLHTYHVLFGTDAVLVHNAYNCAKDALKIQKRLGDGAERYQVGNSSPGTKPMPMDSSHPLDVGPQGWSWHEFVVKDGLAYDKSFEGILLDDYLRMFPGQVPVKVG